MSDKKNNILAGSILTIMLAVPIGLSMMLDDGLSTVKVGLFDARDYSNTTIIKQFEANSAKNALIKCKDAMDEEELNLGGTYKCEILLPGR